MNIMAWLLLYLAWAQGMQAQGCYYNLANGTFTCPPNVRQTEFQFNPSILTPAPMPSRTVQGVNR
jgi:hypothetical protein